MTERQKQWLQYALLVVAILVAGYFGVRYPLPEMPEYVEGVELQAVGPTRFRSIYVDHGATVAGALTASGGVTGDVTGAVTGNVTGNVTGDLTGDMTGDLTNSNFLVLTAQTAVSVTEQAYITATGTYQPLTSAAAYSTSLTTAVMSGTIAGELLILENQNASDVITIVGTGANVECKSDVALGAGDTLWLIWNGVDWYCMSGYDNS